MSPTRPIKNYLLTILFIILIHNVAYAAVMSTISSTSTPAPTTTTAPAPKISTSFTQPTFNLDFSSMRDRSTAQTAMTDARTNWGNFFT